MPVDFGLDGRRAVVTGGTRGIGRAVVRALGEAGARVATCARNPAEVANLRQRFTEDGADGTVTEVDVSDTAAYRSWLRGAAAELGGVDIFVGNVTAGNPTDDPEETWRNYFEVDLMHCVRAMDAVGEDLRRSDAGAVVFVGSVSGLTGKTPEVTNVEGYGALKAALRSYTAQLAQRMGPDGVRVNMVSPGTMYYPGSVWERMEEERPDLYAERLAGTPLRRLGTPEEVAAAVVFLASPASSYVTGMNLRVDGGLLGDVT